MAIKGESSLQWALTFSLFNGSISFSKISLPGKPDLYLLTCASDIFSAARLVASLFLLQGNARAHGSGQSHRLEGVGHLLGLRDARLAAGGKVLAVVAHQVVRAPLGAVAVESPATEKWT